MIQENINNHIKAIVDSLISTALLMLDYEQQIITISLEEVTHLRYMNDNQPENFIDDVYFTSEQLNRTRKPLEKVMRTEFRYFEEVSSDVYQTSKSKLPQ